MGLSAKLPGGLIICCAIPVTFPWPWSRPSLNTRRRPLACSSPDDLRTRWANPVRRAEIVRELTGRGIDFQQMAAQVGRPDADLFDLLCHLAFNTPLRTRRERADRVKREQAAFFAQFAPEARAVLNDLLDKYAEHGTEQFVLPDVLQIPPISRRGQLGDIINFFGGADRLRAAMEELEALVYAA